MCILITWDSIWIPSILCKMTIIYTTAEYLHPWKKTKPQSEVRRFSSVLSKSTTRCTQTAHTPHNLQHPTTSTPPSNTNKQVQVTTNQATNHLNQNQNQTRNLTHPALNIIFNYPVDLYFTHIDCNHGIVSASRFATVCLYDVSVLCLAGCSQLNDWRGLGSR